MKVWNRLIARNNLPLTLLPAALLALPVLLFDLCNLRAILRFFHLSANDGDSWNAMRSAWTWFATPHQGNLYQQVFFAGHIKFQYPPSSLLLFKVASVFHLELTNRFLNAIDYAIFCIEAAAVGYVTYVAVRKLAPPDNQIRRQTSWTNWAAAIAATLLTLDFGPALVAAAIGQVQTWLNSFFVIACLCWLKDRRFFAGLCIGAICILKPQFALFALWGVLRKERSFLAGWAVVILPVTAISLAVFGVANHLDYLPALQFMSRHGEVYYTNESMNGLLNRFIGNGNSAILHLDAFPPFQPVVYAGTLISSIAILAAALLYRARSRRTNALDFSIAGLSFTLASPIAWNHHYGFLPVVLLLAAVSLAAIASRLKRGALACALVVLWALQGHWVPPPDSLHTGFRTLVQSTVFLACLGALGMLYYLRDTYADRIAPRLEQTIVAEPKFRTN